jgi:HlyD family secretion protein
MNIRLTLLALSSCLVVACSNGDNDFDATGSFETDETIISSEASGVIQAFDLTEGAQLKKDQVIGYIDSTSLVYRKQQIEQQIQAVLSTIPDISAQTAALKEQVKSAERDRQRIKNLLDAGAATQKQLDDIETQIEVLKRQIDAQQSSLNISTAAIRQQTEPLRVQLEDIQYQLSKCEIRNPVAGTVLAKYAEANEVTSPGKPLYKIADISYLFLRVYITGDQLSQVKLGQPVRVFTDDGPGKYKESKGSITWISDQSEFTPKTIQTKDERANLVYATRIRVANDGTLKIGMYGEVRFQP